jgi:hypothetical protein
MATRQGTAAAPQRKTFTVTLGGAGKLGQVAFVELPFDAREVWGKSRVPVKGTINEFPFRTTIATMKGAQCFCVNAGMRRGAGVEIGEVVKITLEPDTEKRTIEIPLPMKKALGAALTKKLEALAYTHQKEFVNWYSEAKKDETRERRVARMKEMLASGETIS